VATQIGGSPAVGGNRQLLFGQAVMMLLGFAEMSLFASRVSLTEFGEFALLLAIGQLFQGLLDFKSTEILLLRRTEMSKRLLIVMAVYDLVVVATVSLAMQFASIQYLNDYNFDQQFLLFVSLLTPVMLGYLRVAVLGTNRTAYHIAVLVARTSPLLMMLNDLQAKRLFTFSEIVFVFTLFTLVIFSTLRNLPGAKHPSIVSISDIASHLRHNFIASTTSLAYKTIDQLTIGLVLGVEPLAIFKLWTLIFGGFGILVEAKSLVLMVGKSSISDNLLLGGGLLSAVCVSLFLDLTGGLPAHFVSDYWVLGLLFATQYVVNSYSIKSRVFLQRQRQFLILNRVTLWLMTTYLVFILIVYISAPGLVLIVAVKTGLSIVSLTVLISTAKRN